jgi:hypothetical protein
MLGRATLAIVVSIAGITVASTIEAVISDRLTRLPPEMSIACDS